MKLLHKILLTILLFIGIILLFGDVDEGLFIANHTQWWLVTVSTKGFGFICLVLIYHILDKHYFKDEDWDKGEEDF